MLLVIAGSAADGTELREFEDTATGIRYFFLAGGSYAISADEMDSREVVNVELSPFYISTTELSCIQAATILISAKDQAASKKSDASELDTDSKLSPAFETVKMLAPLMTEQELVEFLSSPAYDPFGRTPEARHFMESCAGDLIKRLGDRGNTAFETSYYSTAVMLTTTVGGQLPTEAQWAASAKVLADTQCGGSFRNGIAEMCIDFYRSDGLQLMDGRRDPRGPARGLLSPAELEEFSAVSALKARVTWQARRLRVLRDNETRYRHFVLPTGDGVLEEYFIQVPAWRESWGRRGIRLVLDASNVQHLENLDVNGFEGRVQLIRIDGR